MKKPGLVTILIAMALIILMSGCSAAAPQSTSTSRTQSQTMTTTQRTTYTTTATQTTVYSTTTKTSTGTVGLAVGGAKDVNNFRENIKTHNSQQDSCRKGHDVMDFFLIAHSKNSAQ